MRRILALLLVIVLCLSATGCSKSQAAKDTETAIKAIGSVDLNSSDAICAAEALYQELTDEEKDSLKNGEDLMAARSTYDALFSAELTRLSKAMSDISTALTSGDVIQCQSLVESMRTELATAHPDVLAELTELCLETGEMSPAETLDAVGTILEQMCINNTSIARPEYVLQYASKGGWLVNDHGDFAAYNWWCTNPSDLQSAYQDYKSYVSQYTEITDLGDSFTFLDNAGNVLTVSTSASKNAILQVRVPRF